jgi:pimeloyl-ACP methyl ester carboxylesterase
MCSGLGGRLELLAPLARSLFGIETITFDAPGVGESPAPWHPYSLPMLASLTGCHAGPARLRRRRPVRVLVGRRAGPAVRHPVAVAVSPADRAGDAAALQRSRSPQAHRRRSLRRPRPDGTGARGRLRATDRTPAGSFGYWLQLAAIAGWSSHSWLPAVRQPTLILAGDDDPLIPLANAHWMASLLPNSRLHVLSDGHYFIRTSVEETSRVIREFLEP